MANFKVSSCLLPGILLYITQIIGSAAGETCITNYGHGVIECKYGCCGDSYDSYCCTTSIGLIIACIVAGMIVITLIISLVCCCYHISKKKPTTGIPIQPATNVSPAYHVYHMNPPWPTQGGSWQGPPGYSAPLPPLPSYREKEAGPQLSPPAYGAGYNPQNYGMAGQQPTPPSAPAGNLSVSSPAASGNQESSPSGGAGNISTTGV